MDVIGVRTIPELVCDVKRQSENIASVIADIQELEHNIQHQHWSALELTTHCLDMARGKYERDLKDAVTSLATITQRLQDYKKDVQGVYITSQKANERYNMVNKYSISCSD